MFSSIFESIHTRSHAAETLASLTVSSHDQVVAFQGIFKATDRVPTVDDWRPAAAAAFIRASSFISSDLVDAALQSKHTVVRIALVEQYQLLSANDQVRVFDTADPAVVTAVAAFDLLPLLPQSRAVQMLVESPGTADLILCSDLVSAEHLRVALTHAYTPSEYVGGSPSLSKTFRTVVDRLGFDVVASVVKETPPSLWWIPLLKMSEFDPQLTQQFFEIIFKQLTRAVSGPDLSVSPPRAVAAILRAGLAAIEEFGSFPALYEPAAWAEAVHGLDAGKDLICENADADPLPTVSAVVCETRLSPFVAQLFPSYCQVLAVRAAVAVEAGSGTPAPISKRVRLIVWAKRASVAQLRDAWLSGRLTYTDVVDLVEAGRPPCWVTVSTILDALSTVPSFVAVLPDLYQLLLVEADNRMASDRLHTVAAAMPFEMQLSSLVLKHLVVHVDQQRLRAWRLAHPEVSFEMIPPVVSDDVPLAVVEAVAAPDSAAPNSAASGLPLGSDGVSPDSGGS